MKTAYTMLIVILITMQTSFSQTTSTLPLNQKKEIIKGLKQGEDLKSTILQLQKALKKASQIHKNDSLRIVDKEKIILLLEKSNRSKNDRIGLTENENDINRAILKEKFSKRFSLGFSFGTTLGEGFNKLLFFIVKILPPL